MHPRISNNLRPETTTGSEASGSTATEAEKKAMERQADAAEEDNKTIIIIRFS